MPNSLPTLYPDSPGVRWTRMKQKESGMYVITGNIGELVLREIAGASEVKIASAYFCPHPEAFQILSNVPSLSLVVSEEFTVNNPKYLKLNGIIRSVPMDHDEGKLHAKVFIVTRPNGSKWAIVGSANMTYGGFFRNQEACVVIEDMDSISGMETWFDRLVAVAHVPDLEAAQKIFNRRKEYRLEVRPEVEDVDYWIMKTTSGSSGRRHWPEFMAEQVVAVGWEGLREDPSLLSDEELKKALIRNGDNLGGLGRSVKDLRRFIGLNKNDIVLCCRGFNSRYDKPVHIFGVARVTGPFRADPYREGEWRFKHDAVVQEIGKDLRRDAMAQAVGKETLMGTIHEIEKSVYTQIVEELRQAGVQVDV